MVMVTALMSHLSVFTCAALILVVLIFFSCFLFVWIVLLFGP